MVQVKSYSSGSIDTRDVDESVFGDRILRRTLKDAVVMYEANMRSGTAKARTRGEVKGPNHKLWKQKHTGRARMGTTKAPHWRGGGAAFGPRPRDYTYHMPKKARRSALRSALLSKFQDGEVALADGWPSEKPNTKAATSILDKLGLIGESVLVVTAETNKTVYLSLRNVPRVDVRAVSDLNAFQVLLRKHLVLTPGAFERLEQFGAAQSDSKQVGTERGAES